MKLDRMLSAVLTVAISCGISTLNAMTQDPLATLAERSGYTHTGRYEEVERLCKGYEARWPQAIRCFEFGRTPEGRPMLALAVSRALGLTPEDARAHNLPVLLIQGGIHSGEIDGKDAGFLALRNLLESKTSNALDRIVIVFVPVFNIDGHERFGHWNRPNQVGPEEMGWRVTAQNLNLNRDYMKADAPEMVAMLHLLNAWDPIVYADLHVTDGGEFQYEVSNLIEPFRDGDPKLRPLGQSLMDTLNERIRSLGDKPVPFYFYPSLKNGNDPASGFEATPFTPRYSTGYWAQRNRFALLVETHAWKNYRTRVRVTHDIVIALIEMAARDGQAWMQVAHASDERARALGGTRVPLAYTVTERSHSIDFLGYAYKREPSAVSGALALSYDIHTPEVWHVPLYEELAPAVEEIAPTGGYVVPPAHAAWVAERLALHGIETRLIEQDLGKKSVEEFRAEKVDFAAKPFEGHMMVTLDGQWSGTERPIGKGSLFVPIAQAKARLVMNLLEPRAPDSFAAWGFFNAHFERKEYMEAYVTEAVAREMLAKDPELAAQFVDRLAKDPQFEHDPAERLEFFARRHASWDDRLNVYPVVRVARDALQ
jgi:hypothetical protein